MTAALTLDRPITEPSADTVRVYGTVVVNDPDRGPTVTLRVTPWL